MIILKIHEKEKFIKEYYFDLNQKIIDIKKIILKDTYDNEYNDLDFENISDRIYKDFGKLFFDKGFLPNTIDNYKLDQFTNDNRTFSFIIHPKNIDNIKMNNINHNNSFLKKMIKEEKMKKNNEFIIDDDDFPPLGSK